MIFRSFESNLRCCSSSSDFHSTVQDENPFVAWHERENGFIGICQMDVKRMNEEGEIKLRNFTSICQ
jgi:hypothetical protein